MQTHHDPITGRHYTVDPSTGQSHWVDPRTEAHPLPGAPGRAVKPRTVAGISGSIIGAVALLLSWVPIINNVAFVLALVSGALATIGLVATRRTGRRSSRWTAGTALVLTVLSMAIVLSTQALYGKALDTVPKALQTGTKALQTGTKALQTGTTDNTGAGPDNSATGTALPKGVAHFGATAAFSDGSTLTCTKPVAFRRNQYAIGAENAAAYLKSHCTFTNHSTKTFEPAGTSGSMTAGGAEGESVYQSDLDSPNNPVLPGHSVSWWMGYGVTSTAGIQLTVRLGFLNYDAVTFV